MQVETTYVLIVGGGPVGMTAALELAHQGAPAILITENTETARHPKCNLTNARSMEFFRRLGLSQMLRSTGLPPELPRESAYVTRFCGHEFGRLPRPLMLFPTPELPNFISQIRLEEQLRGECEKRGLDLRFGCRLVSFEQGDDGVEALVEDVASGERRIIRASYMIAADGAASPARKALGVEMRGEGGDEQRAFMGGTMLSFYIEAPDLLDASGRRPAQMTWIINRDMRAMMYAQDARTRWVVHFQVPPGVDWREVDAESTIRDMLGSGVDFRIISGGPWRGGLALVADTYRAGRVFLAGDAAHLFTPLGGFGMNTGIGDVMNIGWKLAAVHQGWGGDALLDTFDEERRPIGLRNKQIGVHCSRIMDRWVLPDALEADGPEGDAARATFGEQVVREDRVQYYTVGLQLGERYASRIVAPDGEPVPPDDWEKVWPEAFPGARAPHALLEGEPLMDRFGKGFTLLAHGAESAATIIAAQARDLGVPLTLVSLDDEAAQHYPRKLTLVRPDHHIAWHGDEAGDVTRALERATGRT